MRKLRLAFAAMLLTPLYLTAQDTLVSVEAGFQVTDNNGNEDVYRTQVNEDEGLIVRSFNLTHVKPDSSFINHFSLDASGFGALPHGRLAISADDGTRWRLKLNFRRFEQYSALPNFANPLLEEGIIPGQHTYDRTRQIMDLELKLFTDKKIQPLLAYRWNDYNGPGRTSYHLGEDEFLLDEVLDESEHEFRLGLVYKGEALQAEIVQGWRSFSGEQKRVLQTGAGDGNVLRPYLGEDLFLNNFSSSSRIEADTPVTSGNLRAALHANVDLLATFIHADSETDVAEDETFSGRLASYRVSRFFRGGSESIRAHTESPSWNGHLRLETTLPADFELGLGYTRRSRELDGNALATTLFQDSITFGGGDPGDYQRLIDARTHMEKDDDAIELRLTSHALANFRLWAEAAQIRSETKLDADLAAIVLNGGQEGSFQRDIDRYRLGAAYHRKGHRFSAEWQRDEADSAVVRTDFKDREVVALRARTHLGEKWQLSGRARWREDVNPTLGIDSQIDTFDMGLDLNLNPVEGLAFLLTYGVFDYESKVELRRPDFTSLTSRHLEDGENLEVGCHWNWSRVELSGDFSRYESTGAIDFDLERWSLRTAFPLADKLRGIVEARSVDYREPTLPVANYEAKIYQFLLSWQP